MLRRTTIIEIDAKPKNLAQDTIVYLAVFACCFLFCGLSLAKYAESVLPVFGSYRLMIIQSVASLPFACLLASRCLKQLYVFPFAVIVPVICTVFLCTAMESIAWLMNQLEAGFLARCFLRSVLMGLVLSGWLATWPFPFAWKPRDAWTWTILLWLILPGIYAYKQSMQSRKDFEVSLSSMRLVRASSSLNRFVETAGTTEIRGNAVTDWRHKLNREIANAEQLVASPLPRNASLDAYVQRAMRLLSLSRYEEADQLLLNANVYDSQVLLLRAIAARELYAFDKTELLCKEILAANSSNTEWRNPLVDQLLGESLVGQRKIREAIACFEAAIEKHPESRGDFEMRLGTLFREAGDPLQAINHFKKALKADPSLEQDVSRLIRGLKSNSCRL